MGKASTRAQNKYIDKAYDRINLTVPKGKKEEIKKHAEAQNESVNGFINRAINETIKNDLKEKGWKAFFFYTNTGNLLFWYFFIEISD